MRFKAYLFLILLVFIFYATVGVSFAQTASYTYDDLNRLTKAEYDDGTVIEYTYDDVGNRISKKVTVMASPVTIAVDPRACHIACEPCPIPWGHSDNYNGVVVPIDASNTTGRGITSVSLTVTYDESILTATGASTTGTIAEAWGAPAYSVTAGQIAIDMSGATELAGAGTLVDVSFDTDPGVVCGTSTSPLVLVDVELNGGAVSADPEDAVFTVARYGDVTFNCAPSPFDSAWILEYSVGKREFTCLQLIVGDVSCNGTASPYDSSLILQYSVGKITYFPCEGGGESLLAYRRIDTAQQASSAGAPANITAAKADKVQKKLAVSIPTDAAGESGHIVAVPVNVSDVTGKGVVSVWLAVTYDDSLLTAISASTTGTIAESWGEPTYNVTSGRITIAMASSEPLVGSGAMLNISFQVSDTAAIDSKSRLRFGLAELNEDNIAVATSDGLFTVTGNRPPEASNVVYSTNEDTPLNVDAPGVLANDTDVDKDPLTAVLAGDVSNGTLSLNSDGSFTYTPAANYNGLDSFTYNANDGIADSNTATVTIIVNSVNDVPVVTSTPVTTGKEGESYEYDVEATDPDVGDALTYSLTTSPTGMTIDPATGLIQWTPAIAQAGDNSVVVQVDDGSGGVGTQAFAITVDPVSAVEDVTGMLRVDSFDTYRDKSQFSVTVTLTNIGTSQLSEPLYIVIKNLKSSAVTGTNADGMTPGGDPYYDYSSLLGDGKLDPDETSEARVLIFQTAHPGAIKFDVSCWAQVE